MSDGFTTAPDIKKSLVKQDQRINVPTFQELKWALRIPEIEPKLDKLGRVMTKKKHNIKVWRDG